MSTEHMLKNGVISGTKDQSRKRLGSWAWSGVTGTDGEKGLASPRQRPAHVQTDPRGGRSRGRGCGSEGESGLHKERGLGSSAELG